MEPKELMKELNMKFPPLSIIQSDKEIETCKERLTGCSMKILNKSINGETILVTCNNLTCGGAKSGFGFYDGLPDIPGGFGYFLSCGRGEGFPKGEKLKIDSETGIRMLENQPKNVLNQKTHIIIKPYEEGDTPCTVTFFVNPDQLSALIQLFYFRRDTYDEVIAPMSSGCASVFRIPFNEAKKEKSRAVIGNVDVFSRPHFDKNLFNFTVSFRDFQTMLQDADNCFFSSHIWKGVKSRL